LDELIPHLVNFLVRCIQEMPRWFTAVVFSLLLIASASGGAWLSLRGSTPGLICGWTSAVSAGMFAGCVFVGTLYFATYSDD
jgi:hypothetical protein